MNGQVIPRGLLRCLQPDELVPSNEYEAHNRAAFDEPIWENSGDFMTPPKLTPKDKHQTLKFILDDDEQQVSDFIPETDAIDATDNPMNHKYITDLLINLEVTLYQGG